MRGRHRVHFTVGQLVLGVGLAAMACCAFFAADTDSTWLLFGAFYLSLISPARRWTLRWTPLVLALSVVSYSISGAEKISARLMATLGLVLGLCSMLTIPSSA